MLKKPDAGVAGVAKQATLAPGIVAVIYAKSAVVFIGLWKSVAYRALSSLCGVQRFIFSNCHILVALERSSKVSIRVALTPYAGIQRDFVRVFLSPFEYGRLSKFWVLLVVRSLSDRVAWPTQVPSAFRLSFVARKFFQGFNLLAVVTLAKACCIRAFSDAAHGTVLSESSSWRTIAQPT